MGFSTGKKKIIDEIEEVLGKKFKKGERRGLHKKSFEELVMDLTHVNLSRLTGQEEVAVKIPA